MRKQQLTHIETVNPTASDNIAAGYNVGQWWENTVTGDKFFHKTNGVWQILVSSGDITTIHNDLDGLNDGDFKHLTAAQLAVVQNTSGVNTGNQDLTPYALQDGTILYHIIKWFTPSSTVSTSGVTVTSVGTQFTSTMVGAKLTISGESRIITAFTSSTVVTVASAYSVNYSGVVAGSWGVFSRALSIGATGFVITRGHTGIIMSVINPDDQSNFRVIAMSMDDNSMAMQSSGFSLRSAGLFRWSNDDTYTGAKDLGIRRSAAGVLEIYNGITGGNRRDLSLRKLLVNTAVDDGVNAGIFNGTVTASPATLDNQLPTWGQAKGLILEDISGTKTLSDADNGKGFVLTANCTVTIPNGLSANFNCSFYTLVGATYTEVRGGSVVMSGNTLTTMTENKSCTLARRTASNTFLKVGGL